MNKRFFPMPYEIFSLGLRMPEIALYSYLMSCENRKNYTCYPSYKTIARALNTSVNTVQKYVKALEEKELISTEHTQIFTQNGLKLNGNLLYTIKPIQTAVDYFNQCQLDKVMLESQQNKIHSKFIKAGGNCDFTPN
ncbi:MAG: helix-turn-helix domain-containing protein [Ruminococcus sp.]